MEVANLIWIVAAAMCAGAIGWMSILIGLRGLHAHNAARRALDRKAAHAALISVLLGRCNLRRDLGPYRNRARLMSEALLEFTDLVRGADRELVLCACRALGVDEAMRRRVARGSLAGRLVCIEALAAFPGPKTNATLRRAASRGPRALRLPALKSMAASGISPPLEAVVAALLSGRLPLTAVAAEFVRAQVVADPKAAMTVLATPTLPPATRVLLLDGLGSAGDYATLPCLIDNAAGAAAEVRAAAVGSLGRLMHPAAKPCLARALSDGAWQVRAAAAAAVGASHLDELAPALEHQLTDPVWRVRSQAATALAQLGGGVERLQRVASASAAEPVRSAAALALAERKAA